MPPAFRLCIAVLAILVVGACRSGDTRTFAPLASAVAFTHVGVIDGTGDHAKSDQTLLIKDGRVVAIGPAGSTEIPPGMEILSLPGRSIIPGLVGMHDHLFYQIERSSSPPMAVPAQAAFAALYLAAGVTTIRTAGTGNLQEDLRVKRLVDGGAIPGPNIHLTGPYLNAVGATQTPDEITRQVEDAANQGATSFKAYDTLRSQELEAAIAAAHKRGLLVTGHLCAVGFREAAALGIDNLEHGLFTDTEFYSRKKPDECPNQGDVLREMQDMKISDAAIQGLIADLVRHGVAVTSTLAVLQTYTGLVNLLDPRVPEILSSPLQTLYWDARERWSDPNGDQPRMFQQVLNLEMQFERAFVAAGGRLMAGVDPTGWGGVVAGSGDERQVELLVDAGFSPEAAIKIATANGAEFLREPARGTIAPGTRADLVVVRGDPSKHISDLRNVEIVMKDGAANDPMSLLTSATGSVGVYEGRLLNWRVTALLVILILTLSIAAKDFWRRPKKSA